MNPTEYLKKKGIDIFLDGHNSYKLEAPALMDLTVETWPSNDSVMVSMCHYGEQNGDLMKDPDVLFEVKKDGTVYYREMQNDYMGTYTENNLEIKDFMESLWLPNLYMQGHKLTEKDIEA